MSIQYEMPLPEIIKEMQAEDTGRPRTGLLTGTRVSANDGTLVRVHGVYMPHQNFSGQVNGEAAAHACHELSRTETEVVGVVYYRGNALTDMLAIARFTKQLGNDLGQDLAMVVVDHMAKELYRIEKF